MNNFTATSKPRRHRGAVLSASFALLFTGGLLAATTQPAAAMDDLVCVGYEPDVHYDPVKDVAVVYKVCSDWWDTSGPADPEPTPNDPGSDFPGGSGGGVDTKDPERCDDILAEIAQKEQSEKAARDSLVDLQRTAEEWMTEADAERREWHAAEAEADRAAVALADAEAAYYDTHDEFIEYERNGVEVTERAPINLNDPQGRAVMQAAAYLREARARVAAPRDRFYQYGSPRQAAANAALQSAQSVINTTPSEIAKLEAEFAGGCK